MIFKIWKITKFFKALYLFINRNFTLIETFAKAILKNVIFKKEKKSIEIYIFTVYLETISNNFSF